MFTRETIELVGVPFGLGGKRHGAQLGPAALRLAGVENAIKPFVGSVKDCGDTESSHPVKSEAIDGVNHFDSVLANLIEVRQMVLRVIDNGSIPFVLGGDHSLSIGSIAPAINRFQSDFGVLWIDAHVDYNTPDTSPSGNLHGMPVAAICGFDSNSNSWQRIRTEVLKNQFLDPEKVIWFGLREPDEAERNRLMQGDCKRVISTYEIDRYGLAPMIEHALKKLNQLNVKKLWVSFDVDTLDPFLAPGTGTDVRGGLTYREMHLLAEMLHEKFSSDFQLVGVDVVEVNPILDRNNETAKMAVEWLTSLLGKRIMPKWNDA